MNAAPPVEGQVAAPATPPTEAGQGGRFGSHLFLRALALTYLFAFGSLLPQIVGLVGTRGILPATELLGSVAGSPDWIKAANLPTLFWLDPTDAGLQRLCMAGVILSVVALLDWVPVLSFALLWVLYLSVVFVGQDFLSFQWDNLLLEVGFLAIFLAPLRVTPARGAPDEPPRIIVWLPRLVLLKVMFMSGLLKWLSGDPTWHNLTAMAYHYETQPLPTPLGWLAHQLPSGYHRLETLAVLVLEGLVPLGLIGPRRIRHLSALAILGLMLLIAATGNYGFFNLLTASLCLLSIDDDSWPRWLKSRWLGQPLVRREGEGPTPSQRPSRSWPLAVQLAVAAFILVVGNFPLVRELGVPVPRATMPVERMAHYWRISNSYGLFTVMTTRREEVVVEGTADGEHWVAYSLPFQPGDLDRPPGFVAPYMPRLDWQMWFLTLGAHRPGDWFDRFLERLKEGEPSVTGLLASNPFPDHPPRAVRALVYDYHFADVATVLRTGQWWRRELVGPLAGKGEP